MIIIHWNWGYGIPYFRQTHLLGKVWWRFLKIKQFFPNMEVLTWLNYIYIYILVGSIPTPLKTMTSSLGTMTFPIYGKTKNDPNHQPYIYIYTYLYMCFNWRKWGLVAIYPPTVNVQTEINNVHQNRLSKSWNADLGIKNRCVTREYMKNERATVQTWSITQNRVFWWEHDTFGGVPFSEKLDKPKWWNTMTWCDWNAKPYIMDIS